MKFKYELIALQDDLVGEVDRYVDLHGGSAIYCKPQWVKLIANTYRYKPFYIVKRNAERIVFLLPVLELNTVLKGRRYISLPFSHCVEPLHDEGFEVNEFLEYLHEEFITQRSSRLELRSALPVEDKRIVTVHENIISELDLSNTEKELYSGLSKGHRRHLKRAQTSGLSLVEVDDIQGYEAFYRLELETRRRQGSPPYSKSFFREMYQRLHSNGISRCYLVRSENEYIAGMVIMLSGERAIYGYGGSLSDAATNTKRPNYFLFWEVIKLLRSEGIKILDFGSSPVGHKGLIQFKNGWGAKSHPLIYSRMSSGEGGRAVDRQGRLFKIVSSVLSKLPLCILAKIGPLLLRQFG